MDCSSVLNYTPSTSLSSSSLTHSFSNTYTHTLSLSHTHTHSLSLSHTHTHSLSHTHTHTFRGRDISFSASSPFQPCCRRCSSTKREEMTSRNTLKKNFLLCDVICGIFFSTLYTLLSIFGNRFLLTNQSMSCFIGTKVVFMTRIGHNRYNRNSLLLPSFCTFLLQKT